MYSITIFNWGGGGGGDTLTTALSVKFINIPLSILACLVTQLRVLYCIVLYCIVMYCIVLYLVQFSFRIAHSE